MAISDKTRDRRGWLSEADIAEHIANHTADCRCGCRYCARLRDGQPVDPHTFRKESK